MWIIYLLLIILVMIFSNASIESAKNAVDLFAYSIVPSLFPFFVLTNLLLGSGRPSILPSFLCGYPTGAITCSALYTQGKISKSQAELYSSFTNNAGPTFVIGAVGITMCHSKEAGLLLLCTHIAASLTTMLIFRLCMRNSISGISPSVKNEIQLKAEEKKYFGEQLTTAILKALKQVASVGGYIVFFAVLTGILKDIGVNNGVFFSFLEITTGLKHLISSLPQENFMPSMINMLPLISLLLGWSGLSIHAQIIAILNKVNLRARYFIGGKIMQSAFAFIYTYLLLRIPVVKNYIYEIPAFMSDSSIIFPDTQKTPLLLIIEAFPILFVLISFYKKTLIRNLL